MRRLTEAVMVLVMTACGSGGVDSATSGVVETPTSGSTAAPSTATTPVPATTPTLAGTMSTSPVIDVEFTGGEVTGPEVIEVDLGDEIDVWILSDVDGELHVHGYDRSRDIEAGVPFHLTFTADVPGVFEVEIHAGHGLFQLEVIG